MHVRARRLTYSHTLTHYPCTCLRIASVFGGDAEFLCGVSTNGTLMLWNWRTLDELVHFTTIISEVVGTVCACV
jgi:WD40 repeat protein